MSILSRTGVTVTAETSVVFVLHQTKSHLEGGGYYADKLLFSILFSNYLRIVAQCLQ